MTSRKVYIFETVLFIMMMISMGCVGWLNQTHRSSALLLLLIVIALYIGIGYWVYINEDSN